MTKKDIIDAYSILRTADAPIEAIPYEVIEYMRATAIEKLEEEEKVRKFKEQTISYYEATKLKLYTKPNT